MAALDLTSKPVGCKLGCSPGCTCSNFIFSRLGASDLLKHWSTPGHFLSAFQFDHNSNQFKHEEPNKGRTRKHSECQQGSPTKIRRTSPDITSVADHRLSPQGFAHQQFDDPRKSPNSTGSNRSSPVNVIGGYRSPSFSGGVASEVFAHEAYEPTPFGGQHLPQGMVSPQQLSLNALFSLHPSKTRRTSSSPERAVNSEVAHALDDARSGSSSPASASRSLTSPDLPSTSLKMQSSPTSAPTDKATDDKNSIYWQRRIRNNLAAKRSRDLRREREDKIAANCLRMDDIRQRLLYIRSEYIKLLS